MNKSSEVPLRLRSNNNNNIFKNVFRNLNYKIKDFFIRVENVVQVSYLQCCQKNKFFLTSFM